MDNRFAYDSINRRKTLRKKRKEKQKKTKIDCVEVKQTRKQMPRKRKMTIAALNNHVMELKMIFA